MFLKQKKGFNNTYPNRLKKSCEAETEAKHERRNNVNRTPNIYYLKITPLYIYIVVKKKKTLEV